MEQLRFLIIILVVWSLGCSSENTPPEVTIKEPQDNQVFNVFDTININVISSDEDGDVENMKLFWDDEVKFEFFNPTGNLTMDFLDTGVAGNHQLRFLVKDNDGATNEAEINLILINKNAYLQDWLGKYSGQLIITDQVFNEPDSVRMTDIEIDVIQSESDSIVELNLLYDNTQSVKKNVKLSAEGFYSVGWDMGSSAGGLTVEFMGDTLSYRTFQNAGLCCKTIKECIILKE